ncbi:MAG: hypothetical protein Q9168_004693 [Polycauliona sp. 1 TL-2023]
MLNSGYQGQGRHRVDKALVAQAWDTLGTPHRRRQYHRLLGMSDPPEEEPDNSGDTTEIDDTISQDTESDDGSRVAKVPKFHLDDPFTSKPIPTIMKDDDGTGKPDGNTRIPGLPPIQNFRNSPYKKPAVTPPRQASVSQRSSQQILPETPNKGSVREESGTPIKGWITTSAKRLRDDGIDSDYPDPKPKRRNTKKPKGR